jgi:hypothetical protein
MSPSLTWAALVAAHTLFTVFRCHTINETTFRRPTGGRTGSDHCPIGGEVRKAQRLPRRVRPDHPRRPQVKIDVKA